VSTRCRSRPRDADTRTPVASAPTESALTVAGSVTRSVLVPKTTSSRDHTLRAIAHWGSTTKGQTFRCRSLPARRPRRSRAHRKLTSPIELRRGNQHTNRPASRGETRQPNREQMNLPEVNMADVSCFCGCCYSFTGDIGICPQCGEHVTMTRVSPEEACGPFAGLGSRQKRHAVSPWWSDLRALQSERS
jgi:hypothetical protein